MTQREIDELRQYLDDADWDRIGKGMCRTLKEREQDARHRRQEDERWASPSGNGRIHCRRRSKLEDYLDDPREYELQKLSGLAEEERCALIEAAAVLRGMPAHRRACIPEEVRLLLKEYVPRRVVYDKYWEIAEGTIRFSPMGAQAAEWLYALDKLYENGLCPQRTETAD